MDAFSAQGWDVLGLDFSSFGITRFNPHLLRYFVEGDIYDSCESLTEKHKKFDCVNLGNVLEHVLDPLGLLKSLDELLTENGILVITVPNDFSELQLFLENMGDIARRYWVNVPDHLNYFTYESLWSLVSEAGLVPLEVFADFPIEWFLANESSNYEKNSEVGKSAHSARVKLDSFITNRDDFTSVKNFWSALAHIGQGRTVTLLSKKSGI
ncbi:Methyltransferase domain containing protein [Candidatus Nanopelagicaceae bacterium]